MAITMRYKICGVIFFVFTDLLFHLKKKKFFFSDLQFKSP